MANQHEKVALTK